MPLNRSRPCRSLCRAALLAALAAPLAPALPARAQVHAAVLSDAQQAELSRIQAYLDSVRSLKARFLQIGPDGRTAQGTAWLQRPGRMRFEYDKPSPLLLVAGHGLVVFHDAELNQTSNIPIGRTPLGLLLADHITLSGDVTVTDFQQTPDLDQITLVRTAAPGEGSLTLFLNRNPMALVAWTVVDAQGRETRIRLSHAETGGRFDQDLFTFIDPNFFNPNGEP